MNKKSPYFTGKTIAESPEKEGLFVYMPMSDTV